MDENMTFSEHVDVMVAKAFAMLGCIRRLSLEFRDPYTLKSLYTSLEYASCVWNPFYSMMFVLTDWNASRGDLTDMNDLPRYEDRCALLHLDTITKRRTIACVMYIFDVLSGLTKLIIRSRFDIIQYKKKSWWPLIGRLIY
jgi:hypothetical protein